MFLQGHDAELSSLQVEARGSSFSAAPLGDVSSQGWWEEAAAAVSKGSEYTSQSPPAMFRIYMGSAALSRVQGAEMMCSKPFKVAFRWGLRLLFSALPRECWMRLLVRMLSCLR